MQRVLSTREQALRFATEYTGITASGADVYLGPVMITLFTHAIYEDSVAVPPEGFLHPALFTDDLDAELEGHTVVWGPAVVEGVFGKRRIAFVDAPGGIRLEFMEQLEPPSTIDTAP